MTARQTPRRTVLKAAGALPAALAFPSIVRAQAAPVRVGYAIARTGPWTTGAQVSQEPNYLLWAEQQNAAGGLSVKGTRRPIELIGSDDRSDIETCVRTYEKLMGSDKVDLILPPWGSNANFAVAPLATRFGYPFIAPTALSRRLIDMKLPYFFSVLQQPAPMMNALVDMLKAQGAKTLATLYVDDLFGLENYAALKVAVKGAGLEILTAAVAKAGLDRKAIRDYVANTEHTTMLGKIRFAGSENVGTPGTVSQWQKGEFEVVWPSALATAPLVPVKPAWV